MLMSKVMVLEGGAFDRWLAHEGEGFMNVISAPIEDPREFPHSVYHVRIQQEICDLGKGI